MSSRKNSWRHNDLILIAKYTLVWMPAFYQQTKFISSCFFLLYFRTVRSKHWLLQMREIEGNITHVLKLPSPPFTLELKDEKARTSTRALNLSTVPTILLAFDISFFFFFVISKCRLRQIITVSIRGHRVKLPTALSSGRLSSAQYDRV